MIEVEKEEERLVNKMVDYIDNGIVFVLQNGIYIIVKVNGFS